MITVAFGFASAFVPGITNLSNNCRTITAGNTILLSPVSRRRDDNTRRKIVAVLFLRPREGPLPALRGECQGLGHVSQRHPTRAGKDVNGPAKSEKQGEDGDERRPKSHRQAKGNPESLDERIDQSQCAEIQDEEHGSLSIHASEGKDQPTQIDILPPIMDSNRLRPVLRRASVAQFSLGLLRFASIRTHWPACKALPRPSLFSSVRNNSTLREDVPVSFCLLFAGGKVVVVPKHLGITMIA
jgi:hypothetical protein